MRSPCKRFRRGRAVTPIAVYPVNLQERLPLELIYDVSCQLYVLNVAHERAC